MNQKPLKSLSSPPRVCSYIKGNLSRIAKRRYTRDLFDDIIESANSNSEIVVSEEEKLLTLFRCFNNFFNKKFDCERLFKAISYVSTKDRSKILSNWLHQKKADNIYVIGRFVLHISSYLEDQTKIQPNHLKECYNFLKLIFSETSGILDENLILIFSFLSRKGYFRSIMGFILKNFQTNTTVAQVYDNSERNKNLDVLSLDLWILYLVFPLSFAVKWRIKVEDWIRTEAEKSELYGSNGSIDDDYANTSIMNMSLMSVSSEYSSEDPHSRQTRIFLKRLLSSWFNSVYFNDTFYQYFVTHSSISFANKVLISTVPVYLIILALVEPTKQKRKFSIESILSYNKTLLVLYKLNANPSLGLLNLLVCGICSIQKSQDWKNISQEEAYGVIVCIHLTITTLFDPYHCKDNTEKLKFSLFQNHEIKEIANLNENMKSVLNEIKEALSECINPILRIALSGLLDPDVVLPMAYFYQNLEIDLKLSNQTILECRMILSKNVPFLRYLWSLCQQAITSHEISFLPSFPDRRLSECGEKSIIFKLLSEGKLVSIEDLHRFLSILSTILECVTFHLNTLYQAETRRKSSSSYGPPFAAASSHFFLWPELWNMTTEIAALSTGLIKIAASLVNLKEIDISENHCQCSTNIKSNTIKKLLWGKIENILKTIRIFYIHIDKLNSDNLSLDETIIKIDFDRLKQTISKKEIQICFGDVSLEFILKDDQTFDQINKDEKMQLLFLKNLPPFYCRQTKISIVKQFLKQFQVDDEKSPLDTSQTEAIIINYQKGCFLKEAFHQILIRKDLPLNNTSKIVINDEAVLFDQFIIQILKEGLDPVNNLFSCDGKQLIYPNPYVESFYKEYKTYYELLGKIFALNILKGNKVKRSFSPFFLEKLFFVKDTVFNINDLNTVDLEVAKNLLLLSKTDDDLDCFNFKFVLTQNTFGKLHTYEIIKNGSNIPVTKDNKNEYIHRVAEFVLDKQIEIQCEAFRNGINSVFPVNILTLISTKDLQNVFSDV